MKNLFKSFVAVTAAVMAFTGCVKEQPLAPQNNEDTISLTIIADAQPENLTKTQMDGNDVIWSAQEEVNFYTDAKYLFPTEYNKPDIHHYDVTITPDHKLQATLHMVKNGTKFIDGFFGAKFSKAAEVKDKNTNEVSAFGIILPSAQNVTTSTFDPLADALVMDRIDITGVDLKQPIAYATYHRLNAITKLSFTGLDKYASENVSYVEFATTNAELAGEFTYDYVAKKFVTTSGVEKTGSVFNVNASKSVVMNFPQNTKLDANFAAWMVTAAQTLKAGEVITVTISTDKHNFTASFKAPGDKVFTNTQLNTLTLNMAGATVEEVAGKYYEFDMTVAPTLDQSKLTPYKNNYFDDASRFRYDTDNGTSLSLRLGDGVAFYYKNKAGAVSNHSFVKDQSIVLEGKKILSVEWFWDAKGTLSLTANGQAVTTISNIGAEWTAPEGGVNRVEFVAGPQVEYYRFTKIRVLYQNSSEAIFTPEFAAITFNDFAANSTAAQTATVKVYNNPSNVAITLSNLTKFDASITGNQLTVSPKANNETTSPVTEELTLTVSGVSKKVTLKQLPKGEVAHDGLTPETAYTVAEAMAQKSTTSAVWVKGVIVGSLVDNQLVTATTGHVASNLAIADVAGETVDYMPVELKSKSSIRTALNLVDHIENMGKTVCIKGKVQKYFGMPGLKSLSDYQILN